NDLFPSKSVRSKRIVATYDYLHADGTLLYQAVRYEPKDFKQRRPDGNGGRTWKLGKDVPRAPYRLPALMSQPLVLVVEGEKDADALHALNYAATTNVGGAGKWSDQYSRILKAAGTSTVGVIADNDDAGRQHAEQVAASCRTVGLIASIINLPDLPPK